MRQLLVGISVMILCLGLVQAQNLDTYFLSSTVTNYNELFNYRYSVTAPPNRNLCQNSAICHKSEMMSDQLLFIFKACNFHAFRPADRYPPLDNTGYYNRLVTQLPHNISLNLYVSDTSACTPFNSTHKVNMIECLMEHPLTHCLPLADLESIHCLQDQLTVKVKKQTCFNPVALGFLIGTPSTIAAFVVVCALVNKDFRRWLCCQRNEYTSVN